MQIIKTIMFTGDPSLFAIECCLTRAQADWAHMALGCFCLWINGVCYGVREPEATMLGCSYDEVVDRLSRRGRHTAPFSKEPTAIQLADAFRLAIYSPDHEQEAFFGLTHSQFTECIYEQHLLWAPDGDEAFDDGSYVIQFDLGETVRLIAFRSVEHGYLHDPKTLQEVRLRADDFYHVLQQWQDSFESQWRAATATS